MSGGSFGGTNYTREEKNVSVSVLATAIDSRMTSHDLI